MVFKGASQSVLNGDPQRPRSEMWPPPSRMVSSIKPFESRYAGRLFHGAEWHSQFSILSDNLPSKADDERRTRPKSKLRLLPLRLRAPPPPPVSTLRAKFIFPHLVPHSILFES